MFDLGFSLWFENANDLAGLRAATGRLNVKQEELDEMLKEAPGPINFTVFLTMFGEKLKGEEREHRLDRSGDLESAVWVGI